MNKKLHPIAEMHGFSSNADFYKSFPTRDSYEKYMMGGQVDARQNQGMSNPDYSVNEKLRNTSREERKPYKRPVNPALSPNAFLPTEAPSIMRNGGQSGMLECKNCGGKAMKEGGALVFEPNMYNRNFIEMATGGTVYEPNMWNMSFKEMQTGGYVTEPNMYNRNFTPMQQGGNVNPNQYMYQPGGAPITPQERDAWEKMQGQAYQQGFMGDNHNRQPGVDFMKSHGVDPNRLSAYQQDFLNQQSKPGWGGSSVRAGNEGISNADNFYGSKTSQQRYTKYSVVDSDGTKHDFGTDIDAATKYNNNYLANRSAGFNQPTQQPVQPTKDYEQPGYSGFGHSGEAGFANTNTQQQGIAATGFPTREEAIAKYKAKQSTPNMYDGNDDMSDYNMHGGESEEMKKGGKWIPKNLKKGRCTPMGNPDCRPGTPQYNLAKTFKKHHGFHKKQLGGDGVDPWSNQKPVDDNSQNPTVQDTPEYQNNPPTMIDNSGQPTVSPEYPTNDQMQDTSDFNNPYEDQSQDVGYNKDLRRQARINAAQAGIGAVTAAGAFGKFLGDNKKQQYLAGAQRSQGMSASRFPTTNPAGAKGDYVPNTGAFRPNQTTPTVQGYQQYPMSKMGGIPFTGTFDPSTGSSYKDGGMLIMKYQQGGEYEVSPEEMKAMKKAGIRFILTK